MCGAKQRVNPAGVVYDAVVNSPSCAAACLKRTGRISGHYRLRCCLGIWEFCWSSRFSSEWPENFTQPLHSPVSLFTFALFTGHLYLLFVHTCLSFILIHFLLWLFSYHHHHEGSFCSSVVIHLNCSVAPSSGIWSVSVFPSTSFSLSSLFHSFLQISVL